MNQRKIIEYREYTETGERTENIKRIYFKNNICINPVDINSNMRVSRIRYTGMYKSNRYKKLRNSFFGE